VAQAPAPHTEAWFHKTLRTLTPHEALDALRVSLRQRQDGGLGSPQAGRSPVLAGCLYQGLASQALVEHALDRQGVWGVAGWPTEEVLHTYRLRQIQPSRQRIRDLLKALEADESLEALEHRMGMNPADLPLSALRQLGPSGRPQRSDQCAPGLMVMGYVQLRTWLLEQITHASDDPNLDLSAAPWWCGPTPWALSDAGAEVNCAGGLPAASSRNWTCCWESPWAQPSTACRAHHLRGAQTGPMLPGRMAAALESATRMISKVCKALALPVEAVNRALLRTLAALWLLLKAA
jgi:hypothetical protein